jgi:hypothetical protein
MFRLGVHGPLSSHHFGSVGMDFSTWDRKDGTPGVRYGIPMTINDPTCPDVSKRCFEIKKGIRCISHGSREERHTEDQKTSEDYQISQ